MDEKVFVLDEDWHSERIKRFEEWIRASRDQIEWAVNYAASCIEHLKQEEQGLADAIQAKNEFLKGERK